METIVKVNASELASMLECVSAIKFNLQTYLKEGDQTSKEDLVSVVDEALCAAVHLSASAFNGK